MAGAGCQATDVDQEDPGGSGGAATGGSGGVAMGGSGGVATGGSGGAAMGGSGGAAMGGSGGANQNDTGKIPTDIRLWCLAQRSIARADFGKYASHYLETGGTTEIFAVRKGDFDLRNDGVTKECRVEAFDINKWAPGPTWHSFEATFSIKTTGVEETCFLQLKNNITENPQVMCHFKAGQISCAPRGNGSVRLGSLSTNYNDTPFKLKLRSDGNTQELYFNGVKVTLPGGSTPAQTGPTVRNYFRWGIYMNYPAPADYTVTVSNIFHD